jgi:hypothetical protein
MTSAEHLRRELTALAHRAAEFQPSSEGDGRNRFFLPLESHSKALRPEISIVRGGRGAGKTALFQALSNCQSADERRMFFRTDQLPKSLVWVEGFSEQKEHPQVTALDAFAGEVDDAKLRVFWQRHLVQRLSRALEVTGTESAAAYEDPKAPFEAADAASVYAAAHFLDQLDAKVAQTGGYVYVAYDHLDRVGQWDPQVRQRYVTTLLSLWLSLGTRFRAIRPKIFLREDLLVHAEARFPDASKMRAQSVSLDWTVEDLFRAAVRHMAVSPALRDWLDGLIPGLVVDEEGRGAIPQRMPEEVRDTFATALAGRFMGAGVRKGFTHRWIANHLQDGQVRVVPRSLLVLLGTAAERALKSHQTAEKLLSPADLAFALKETSLARVTELREEFPMVRRLQNLEGEVLFLEESEVRRLVAKPVDVSDTWTRDGAAVVDQLVDIGVLVRRKQGRIDVPDLYRYGFDIKRKGGVATPR